MKKKCRTGEMEGEGRTEIVRPTNVPTERQLLHDFFCTVCEKKVSARP